MTGLSISICPGWQLSPAEQAEIVALCSIAYDEDAAPWVSTLFKPVHVIGRVDGRIVSHAAWVERWLEPAGTGWLRTAYIEAVATLPEAQGRGHGGHIMRALPPLLGEYDVAALSASDTSFYARLGWEPWLGALSVWTLSGVIAATDEEVMIYRLGRTPAIFDLTAPLSIDGRGGETW